MKKIYTLISVIIFSFFSCSYSLEATKTFFPSPGKSYVNPYKNTNFMSRDPVIIKAKTYQNNTIALVWFDMNGDGKAEVVVEYTKKDNYIIERPMDVKSGDIRDMLLETPI